MIDHPNAAVTVEGPSAPRVSALGTAALMGLLDGGATHALRSATEKEWSEARPISVHLATGQAQLKVNKLGTLLPLASGWAQVRQKTLSC